ncbi:YbaN family protein [Pseudomonadota bacterium]
MTKEKITIDYSNGDSRPETKPYLRPLLIIFGWMCVVVGAIGVITPGLPTTIFLIMAAWAFARSSPKFHSWLYEHKYFGPTLRNWDNYRIIPVNAKIFAVLMMMASIIYVVVFVAEDWLLPALMLSVMIPTAIYILTRNSHFPSKVPDTQ